MARGIPAIVTPEVLQWARDLDRITIDEIAQKLNVDAAKVSAWENGNEHPSLTQAKKLAKQYRVPSDLQMQKFICVCRIPICESDGKLHKCVL